MKQPYVDLIELEGITIKESTMAVLIDFGEDEHIWVPKSQLEDWPYIKEFGSILIKEWIAKEKGLI